MLWWVISLPPPPPPFTFTTKPPLHMYRQISVHQPTITHAWLFQDTCAHDTRVELTNFGISCMSLKYKTDDKQYPTGICHPNLLRIHTNRFTLPDHHSESAIGSRAHHIICLPRLKLKATIQHRSTSNKILVDKGCSHQVTESWTPPPPPPILNDGPRAQCLKGSLQYLT